MKNETHYEPLDLAFWSEEQKAWALWNFPETPRYRPLLGALEELGELAHAHLKAEQGIRGYDDPEFARDQKMDAVGDIIVYLNHYCALNDINLGEALQRAWNEVKNRDWIRYPGNGLPPADAEHKESESGTPG